MSEFSKLSRAGAYFSQSVASSRLALVLLLLGINCFTAYSSATHMGEAFDANDTDEFEGMEDSAPANAVDPLSTSDIVNIIADSGDETLVASSVFVASKFRRRRRMRTTANTADCSIENICGEHGSCVPGVGCVCNQDTTKGFWALGNDGKCSDCSSGFAGSLCLIECQGGSCNQCNGNGRCSRGIQGDGTCQCFTDSSGHWAGSSCSQCAPGFFGTKCTSSCPGVDTNTPCALRGECVVDGSGLGYCKCNPGYGSDSGCVNCDAAHYAYMCSLTCPGYVTSGTDMGKPCSGHGRCNNGTNENGTCQCDTNYGLEDCSKQCPNACSQHGKCDDGSLGTAMCACDKSHAPPDCFHCIANMTGEACDIPCPLNSKGEPCSNHGTCYSVLNTTDPNHTYIGACNCSAGYAGKLCDISCPGDPPCSGHGACTPKVNGTGFILGYYCECFQSNVTGFWDGSTCSSCSLPYNGSASCNVPCPMNQGKVCNNSGYCAEGKCFCIRADPRIDYYDNCGWNCNMSSQAPVSDSGAATLCGQYLCVSQYSYGVSCDKTCPFVNGFVCGGNGYCAEGKEASGKCTCYFGYAGDDCTAQCPISSLNGLLCSGQSRGDCLCIGSTSACVPRCKCKDGFAGATCELNCPVIAGQTCSGHGTCDQVTAQCSCQSEFTGVSCSVPCGCNTANGRCNATTCAYYPASETCNVCVCNGNFTGICNICKNGTQGITCGGPCVNGQTSNTTKDCICLPNWSTASCTVPCLNGTNGLICSGKGYCASGNRFSGACVCNASYYGKTCENYCTETKCKALGLLNPQCNPDTGNCECLNSTNGRWSGDKCDQCQFGYWGTACTDECDCSGHGSCDASSCYCTSDPKNGFFTGTTCSQCSLGYIGSSCNVAEVGITRLSRSVAGLSGYFLNEANTSLKGAGGLNPLAPVAAIDEYNKLNILYAGGRPVARFSTSSEALNVEQTTTNASIFTDPNCTEPGDVAYVFTDSKYHFFLMQPVSSPQNTSCSLPIRLIILDRATMLPSLIKPLYLNLLTDGLNPSGDPIAFNNTVRVIAATSISDTGDTTKKVPARLAFLVAETYLDSTTGFLAPYVDGWVVHVDVDTYITKNTFSLTNQVARKLTGGFLAKDISFSPFSPDDKVFSVMAVGGSLPSQWELQAFVVNSSTFIVNAFGTAPSVSQVAPCWPTVSGGIDKSACSYCSRVERIHWFKNDMVLAISSNLSNTDTLLVWLQRIQDLPVGSQVLYNPTPDSSVCKTVTLQQVGEYPHLVTSTTDRNISGCVDLLNYNCPGAVFNVLVTQVGVEASQATAIAFDSFSNTTYVALRVNSGNSASVLVKASLRASNFVVYGMLSLGYVTSNLGKTRPEVLAAMAVAKKQRMLFGAVSGVQTLSVVTILLNEVSSIQPDIADQRPGTNITILGNGFAEVPLPDETSKSKYYPVQCRFGSDVYVPARLVSSTVAICTAPLESETTSSQTCGKQNVEISMYNTTFFTRNSISIQRAQSAKLISVSPLRGAMTSAVPQVINITGTGFQNSTFSRCKFFSNSPLATEVLTSPVVLITPNLIQCVQPNATQASYDTALLDVSIDGQQWTIDGPILYQIVGDAAGILNDPQILTVQAAFPTAFSITTMIVDERLHQLDTLDRQPRTVYLLLNVSYDSSCAATSWRPQSNCIPNYWLANASYPNASFGSHYSVTPCQNESLNGVVNITQPWSVDTSAGDLFNIGYNTTTRERKEFQGVRVFSITVPPRVGKVVFSDLFFIAPRVGTVTLTMVVPGTSWTSTTHVVITPGQPFALAIFNIADFESYSPDALQSKNCSESLTSKFYIVPNTPIAQVELVIVDAMANVINVPVNSYDIKAQTLYVQDFDNKVVVSLQPAPAPTQRDSKFLFSEITLPPLHGAAHFVNFTCNSTTSGFLSTVTPPIRTKNCLPSEYKLPLSGECKSCPGAGALCDGTELIVVKPGYWRANGSSTKLYLCPGGPTICLGSYNAPNLSFCAPGHTGPLCTLCWEGYGRASNNCVPCSDVATTALLVALIVLAIFIVVIVWTIVTLRNAETTDLSVIMRTVVNHMQATGELGQFSSQYGPFLQSFMSGQGSAGGSVSINGLQSFDCLLRLTGQNYTAIFTAFMCLPLVAVVLAVVVFGVVRALGFRPVITAALEREIQKDIRNFGDNAKSAVLLKRYPMYMVVITTNCVLMFTLYQNIITQCAKALQCNDYVFSEDVTNPSMVVTKYFLAEDLSIPCPGGSSPLSTPALLFAAVYGLGIPLAFTMGYMYMSMGVTVPEKEKHDAKKVLENKVGKLDGTAEEQGEGKEKEVDGASNIELTKLIFMFLCGGYKPQLFFWQNLIMIRKLILVLMIVFLKDSQELLNYCAMWVMSISLVLQVWLQPAENDEHNLVESISLAVIVITLNLGLLYFWSLSTFAQNSLTLALILITLGVLIVFVYFIVKSIIPDIIVGIQFGKDLLRDLKKPKDTDKKRRRIKLDQIMLQDDDAIAPTVFKRGHGNGIVHTEDEFEFAEFSDDESTSEQQTQQTTRTVTTNNFYKEDYYDDL